MNETPSKTGDGAQLGAIALGAIALGAGFWLASRPSAPALAPARGTPSALVPKAGSSPMYQRAPIVAERIKTVWSEATGGASAPTPAMMEILLSMAALESAIAEPGVSGWSDWIGTLGISEPAAYGLLLPFTGHAVVGWAGAMHGSGNLGAEQCTQAEQNGPAARPYYTCEAYEDSAPNADGTQTKYAVKFRYFHDYNGRPAGEWAALDFVEAIAKNRPAAFAALQTGDVGRFARALYETHYYQGFGKTDEERIGTYVKAISRHLPAIAAALGHDRIFATGTTT